MMEAAETPTDPRPRAEPAGATILVCDDEPSLRELVRAVLGPDYRFLEAADGKAALALAYDVVPDLVVLDLMLPVMSGIAVLEELRSDERLAGVPVIVMTAWSHAESSAWTAGADRFVSKPFDPDELTAAVEELLS
jgi:DNA-binding response OmpR family regulator